MTSFSNEANKHTLSLFPELSEIFEYLPNYQVVNEGLVRGGQPEGRGFEILMEEGIKTVLNIREQSEALAEEGDSVRALGMNYAAHSVHPFKVPEDELILDILTTMLDTDKAPVFVHCLHGQDRTGMIVGIYRLLVDDWSLEEAYAEMLAMGFHSAFTNLKEALHRFDSNRHNFRSALQSRLGRPLLVQDRQGD